MSRKATDWTVVPKLKKDIDLEFKRERPDCFAEACHIQTCLDKQRWQQAKCQHLIDSLHICCIQIFHQYKGRVPVSCPDLDKNPLQQHYYKQLKRLGLQPPKQAANSDTYTQPKTSS